MILPEAPKYWKWGIEISYYYCITVYFSINSINVCRIYLDEPMLNVCICIIVIIFFMNWLFYHYILYDSFLSHVYFGCYTYATTPTTLLAYSLLEFLKNIFTVGLHGSLYLDDILTSIFRLPSYLSTYLVSVEGSVFFTVYHFEEFHKMFNLSWASFLSLTSEIECHLLPTSFSWNLACMV